MPTIKSPIFYIVILLFIVLQACDGVYKPSSRGKISEVLIVMDASKWNSDLGDALRNSFGADIKTMPRSEPLYDLRFADIRNNADLESIKLTRNVIFVASLDEQSNVATYVNALLSDDVKRRVQEGQNFAFPLRDRWATDQWVLVLTATDEATLTEKIVESAKPLVKNLNEVERERWTFDVFGKAENVALSDSVSDRHKWKIRIQHDYVKSVDTTQFVSFARLMPENYRYVWVFWDENVTDVTNIDQDWIHARRDSLWKKWVQGTRDSSYVVTQYSFPTETETIDFKGYYAFHTRGAWMMNNRSMGGSFIQYTVYVPEQNRLYYIIGSIFAPAVPHRRFLNQFDAIAWTFEPGKTLPDYKVVSASR
jgi:hypothetical protein